MLEQQTADAFTLPSSVNTERAGTGTAVSDSLLPSVSGWMAKALKAAMDHRDLIDVASTGQADGICTEADLLAAFEQGVFDHSSAKDDISRLVTDPSGRAWLLGKLPASEITTTRMAPPPRLELRSVSNDGSTFAISDDSLSAVEAALAALKGGTAPAPEAPANPQQEGAGLVPTHPEPPSLSGLTPAPFSAETLTTIQAAIQAIKAGQAGQAPEAATTPTAPAQPPATSPPPANEEAAAEDTIDPHQQAREVLINTFGFVDAAGQGSQRDGFATRADLATAAASKFMQDADRVILDKVAKDPALFDALDRRDGVQDGRIKFTALEKAQLQGEGDLWIAEADVEVPRIEMARYSEYFYQSQDALANGAQPGQPLELEDQAADGAQAPAPEVVGGNPADPAGFKALDALDGAEDGKLNPEGLKLSGVNTQEILFTQKANDGSGRSVLEAAMGGLSDEFANHQAVALPEGMDRQMANRVALALWDNLGHILTPEQQTSLMQANITKTGEQPEGQSAASPQPVVISRQQIEAAIASGKISSQDAFSLRELLGSEAHWNWLGSSAGGDPSAGIKLDGLHDFVTDFHKANFSGILMAAGAINNGVPMRTAPNSGDQFSDDMSADYCAGKVFDPAAAQAAYNRLMGDPAVQENLSQKIRQFTPEVTQQARDLYQRITSPYYFGSLEYLENQENNPEAAQQKVGVDLAALMTLDPELGRKAAEVLIQNKFIQEIDNATPGAIEPEHLMVATRDLLALLTLIMRSGRGAVRLPGLLAGHDKGWKAIIDAMGSFKSWSSARIDQLAETLAKALGTASRAEGMARTPSTEALLSAADNSVGEAAARVSSASSAAERGALTKIWQATKQGAADLKSFLAKMEAHGVWGSLAGGISIASGVYKLCKGGEVLGKDPWGRLSIANDFVLAACFTPAYLSSANSIASRLGMGWKPTSIGFGGANQTFSQLLKGAVWGDTTALQVAGVQPTRLGAAVGSALKGFTGFSLMAAGAIGNALGIKQIIDASKTGNKPEIAAGSLSVVMGTAWFTSGITFLLGSSLTGPLVAIGIVFGIAAVLISMFNHHPDQDFATRFHDRLGQLSDSGVLRPGWEGALKDWFNNNRDVYNPNSGVALDM